MRTLCAAVAATAARHKTELLVVRLRGDVWTDELDAAPCDGGCGGAVVGCTAAAALLHGLRSSAGATTGGWEAEVRPHLSVFPLNEHALAFQGPLGGVAGYDIQATETLTLTLPACCLRDAARGLPAGSFALKPVAAAVALNGSLVEANVTEGMVREGLAPERDGALALEVALRDDEWVDGATNTSLLHAIARASLGRRRVARAVGVGRRRARRADGARRRRAALADAAGAPPPRRRGVRHHGR